MTRNRQARPSLFITYPSFPMNSRSIAILIISGATLLAARGLAAGPVRLTEGDTVIPTYLSGAPDPNPMFNFGRQSQGAAGRIYPYPLLDNLTNRRGEQTYHLVYLENEYVRIAIAPELGGRLFSEERVMQRVLGAALIVAAGFLFLGRG